MHSRSGLELPTTQYLSKSPQTTVSSTRQQVPGTYSSLTSTRHSRSSTRFQVYDNDFLAVHGVQAQISSCHARSGGNRRTAAGGLEADEGMACGVAEGKSDKPKDGNAMPLSGHERISLSMKRLIRGSSGRKAGWKCARGSKQCYLTCYISPSYITSLYNRTYTNNM